MLSQLPFQYPDRDDTPYREWFHGSFSSIFVATNDFLYVPEILPNKTEDWIPPDAYELAKQRGSQAAISWAAIAELCGFSSIAHVNRALRLTGSKRIHKDLACVAETQLLVDR